MHIKFHEEKKIFHIYNKSISYIMMVLENGHLGQLYFGKQITDQSDFSHLLEMTARPMSACVYENNRFFSMEHIKQEYPSYGAGDFRHGAIEVQQKNGSRLSDFTYRGYVISDGKPKLEGLPATYTEETDEAKTLTVQLADDVTGIQIELLYTIFASGGILARSARIINAGKENVSLTRAMSLSLDMPDYDYEWVQLSGAWSRERHVKVRRLEQGIQAIDSMRGHSSHEHNPFIVLKRPFTTEEQGEAIGCCLIYSGNFLMQAEVDTHDTTRITTGIHPDCFAWQLAPNEQFQTPEAVLVYTADGLNQMSQAFHKLFRKRLARGYWRDRPRPILNNNWEATYFDFNEEKLLHIARKAKECGVELFVLDDGWFGDRRNDKAGLGDWYADKQLLPNGIAGLSEKIEALGMKFGLWIEPEMVNKDSDLYRSHPEYMIETPDRSSSPGRNQFVLDFSRKEVVDTIYDMLEKVLTDAKVSYIKWDMNRSITECYSPALPAGRQGEVFHRYIMGVYDLYERLISRFPHILFESCASGGGRFDAGMLYYAPQAWASDNSDAIDRLKIQYGTSMCYPISSIGSHVSVVPNHQVHRMTPLSTRANVAYFGTFGYELDLNSLTLRELDEVKQQVSFMKEYREILQFGSFYRLKSPFEGNETVWMVVSEDKGTAIVGWYRILNGINQGYSRVKLQGMNPDYVYTNMLNDTRHYGDELMNLGLITTDSTAGENLEKKEYCTDFESRIYVLKGVAFPST